MVFYKTHTDYRNLFKEYNVGFEKYLSENERIIFGFDDIVVIEDAGNLYLQTAPNMKVPTEYVERHNRNLLNRLRDLIFVFESEDIEIKFNEAALDFQKYGFADATDLYSFLKKFTAYEDNITFFSVPIVRTPDALNFFLKMYNKKLVDKNLKDSLELREKLGKEFQEEEDNVSEEVD